MDDIELSSLFLALGILILISAFFSGSEIGMMSINRYRLKHLAQKNKKAKRVQNLLKTPDRLLGVILIGNTLANILASSIATIIGQRLYGAPGMAIATGALTFIILIFSEMTPKTLAALYPERVAFPTSFLLHVLLKLFSPVITLTSFMANALLRTLGVKVDSDKKEIISGEELKTVVNESGVFSSRKQKNMLLSLLDLEKVTVNDIMVPRSEVIGLDIADPWDELLEQLETAQHTRLPVFNGDLENLKGHIHLRSILNLMANETLTLESLLENIEEPYFIIEGTPLYQQLAKFQKDKKRSGFIIDEYGDIQGLTTLEDILEEIVGEFTTDIASMSKNIIKQEDGYHLIDGSATIRELNKDLKWSLSLDGPKTLNGLITEYLGFIPPADCCLKINNTPCEILQIKDNAIKTVKIGPIILSNSK